MRHLIIMAVGAMMVCPATVMGQKKWSITPQAGINIPFMTGDSQNLNEKTGFSVGAEAECALSSKIGLSFGAYYTKTMIGIEKAIYTTYSINASDIDKYTNNPDALLRHSQDTHYLWGFTTMDTDKYDACLHRYNYRFSTQTLNIPVMVNYYLWKGLTLKAGLQLGIALSNKMMYDTEYQVIANPTLLAAVGMPLEPYTKKDNSADIKDLMTDMSVSIPLGISYEYRHFVLDIRYAVALSNYGSEKNYNWSSDKATRASLEHGITSDEIEAAGNSRLNSLTVSLGYQFIF